MIETMIQTILKEPSISPKVDGRMGQQAHNKIDRTKIIEHIKSFNSSISHYRREHVPNRLYPPSDLTITRHAQ